MAAYFDGSTDGAGYYYYCTIFVVMGVSSTSTTHPTPWMGNTYPQVGVLMNKKNVKAVRYGPRTRQDLGNVKGKVKLWDLSAGHRHRMEVVQHHERVACSAKEGRHCTARQNNNAPAMVAGRMKLYSSVRTVLYLYFILVLH